MALPTQRIRLGKYQSSFDPVWSGIARIIGLLVSAVSLSFGLMGWSSFGNPVAGLTLTTLFALFVVDLFRDCAPMVLTFLARVISGACLVALIAFAGRWIYVLLLGQPEDICSRRDLFAHGDCWEYRALVNLRSDAGLSTREGLPLLMMGFYLAAVVRSGYSLRRAAA